jgi:CobQ-like glutamine amidotransferase family enzyme
MNIYGDTGNIIALRKRAEWRGIEVVVKNISLKEKVRQAGNNYVILKKGEVDIYFFGGGQDQSQSLVARDLESSGKGKIIKQEIERGIPLLAICGGYQLLGEYYLPRLDSGKAGKPHKGPKLKGVGLFPAYTIAGDTRMIGNIVIESQFGKLVGFENHSGKTYLKKDALHLGKILKGFGNNGEDQKEGCIYKNAIGCYMHGPLLPKNLELADWLITKALEVKYDKIIELKPLDNNLEHIAQQKAIQGFM